MTTSQQSHSLQNNTSNNELQFPIPLFVNIAAEWLDDLPQDINRFKLHKLKCSPHEWLQKNQYMCYFKMHSSRSKIPTRMRKVGRCIRNLYCAFDECLFKLSAEGKRNAINFQNVARYKFCFSHSHVVSRQWCSTHKMIKYCRESLSLTVFHIGEQTCPFKLDSTKYRNQVRDAVLRNSTLGVQGIQWAEVGEAVAANDIREAWGRAM